MNALEEFTPDFISYLQNLKKQSILNRDYFSCEGAIDDVNYWDGYVDGVVAVLTFVTEMLSSEEDL